MRLPRRAPREVYRLFDEDEYLAGATWEPDVDAVTARSLKDSLWPRIVSAAILLGTTGAVGGLVLLNSLTHLRGSGRRAGPRISSAAGPAASTTVSAEQNDAYSHHGTTTRRLPSRARSNRRKRRRSRLAIADTAMAASSARVTTSVYVASEGAHLAEFGFER